MITNKTLINLINNEGWAYLVGLEIFATKQQAHRKASVLNYYADTRNKQRLSVEKVKAHTLSSLVK